MVSAYLDSISNYGPVPGTGSKNFNPLKDCYRVLIPEVFRLTARDPFLPYFLFRTVKAQRRAYKVREEQAREGVCVPPVMVFSVTNRCNLHCKGCYHHALRDLSQPEMSTEKLHAVVREGHDLGVSLMVFVGGEPLVRQDILPIARDFPDIIFLLFTNGTLLTDEVMAGLRRQRNVVPVLSIEGYEPETDDRRGQGIYRRLQDAMRRLRRAGVFFGTSITVTSANFHTVVDEDFVRHLTGKGCRFVLFSEYTPTQRGTEDLVISPAQREILADATRWFRSKAGALFFAAPGDEAEFGGCLSAGRGFVHVNARGDVEPCPFVPYSDVNLRDASLKDALGSKFLAAIRCSGVEEGTGGCTLWEKRDWVRSLLEGPEKPPIEFSRLAPAGSESSV